MIVFNIFTGTFDFSGGGGSESTQKFEIITGETYEIPERISSVISGPFIVEGIVELNGKLEVL
jgi:hypothetical protein